MAHSRFAICDGIWRYRCRPASFDRPKLLASHPLV